MLAALTVLLFGLIPAFRATSLAPSEAMKSGTLRAGSMRESNKLRRGLVITQVALSLVLVTGSLLLSQTLSNLLDVDAGFRQDNILDFITSLDLSPLRIPVERRLAEKKEIVDRLRALPGVKSASEVVIVPLTGSSIDNRVWSEGEDRQAGLDSNFNWTGDGYFKTLGTPILAGRDFNEQDTLNSPKVAVVNQELARQLKKAPTRSDYRFAAKPRRVSLKPYSRLWAW